MRFPTMATNGLRRPILPPIVEGPDGHRMVVDALVDTGADLTLLPIDVATGMGIDVASMPKTPVSSALGHQLTYVSIDLVLELRSSPDTYRWRATVGILSQGMTYSVLGTRGFFEFFILRYDCNAGTVEIEPHGALPS